MSGNTLTPCLVSENFPSHLPSCASEIENVQNIYLLSNGFQKSKIHFFFHNEMQIVVPSKFIIKFTNSRRFLDLLGTSEILIHL